MEMEEGGQDGMCSDMVIQDSSIKTLLIGHLPKLHSLPHKAIA